MFGISRSSSKSYSTLSTDAQFLDIGRGCGNRREIGSVETKDAYGNDVDDDNAAEFHGESEHLKWKRQ
jgi:hypothetical protein